jgi:hypothetical protein
VIAYIYIGEELVLGLELLGLVVLVVVLVKAGAWVVKQ